MKQEELKELEKSLKERKIIEHSDSIEAVEKGDYWERIFFFNTQTRGIYCFTKKAIVFMGGVMGVAQFAIPYKDIKVIKKCNVGLLVPCGILIVAPDEKKRRDKKYKLSLLKRKTWIKLIEEKIKTCQ